MRHVLHLLSFALVSRTSSFKNTRTRTVALTTLTHSTSSASPSVLTPFFLSSSQRFSFTSTSQLHARGRGKPDGEMRGVKKENLPEKVCVTCGRPFTWRKKWERCWDEVTTCSKSCNAARRRGETRLDGDENKQARKEARKAKREHTADPADFSKPCTMCNTPSDQLIRCTIDASKKWEMVCGRCWTEVSGGVTDGDVAHPHYNYGGLWKNRYAKT